MWPKKLRAKHIESRREYVSEAFHSFNQPLTALHCGLELCLVKQRSEEEYRQRIEDALSNAGTVLRLSKALRELVEAEDAGEDVQRVELEPLLAAVAEQLTVVAEASGVLVKVTCPHGVSVMADPAKLAQHCGNLGSMLTSKLDPTGSVHLSVQREGEHAVIAIIGEGEKRDLAEAGAQSKLDAIRIDAACSYAWTLGGDFVRDSSSFTIRLNALD